MIVVQFPKLQKPLQTMWSLQKFLYQWRQDGVMKNQSVR